MCEFGGLRNSEIETKLSLERARCGTGERAALIRDATENDSRRIDALSCLRLRVGKVGMVQHVRRIETHLYRFRFRNPECLTDVRIKSPFSNGRQRQWHGAAFTWKWIHKHERSSGAIRILFRERVESAASIGKEVKAHGV